MIKNLCQQKPLLSVLLCFVGGVMTRSEAMINEQRFALRAKRRVLTRLHFALGRFVVVEV